MQSTAATIHGRETVQITQASLAVPLQVPGLTNVQEPRGTADTISKPLSLVLSTQANQSYRNLLGCVTISVSRKQLLRGPNAQRTGKRTLVEIKTFTITPSFMKSLLYVRFVTTCGSISRALTIYPIVDDDAPVFGMCRSGDLQGLQAAFSDGTMSPLVVDADGWTLLHVSILVILLA